MQCDFERIARHVNLQYWQLRYIEWNRNSRRWENWRVFVAAMAVTFKFNNKVAFTTHLHRISVNWIHLHDFSSAHFGVLSFSVHANFVIVYVFKHILYVPYGIALYVCVLFSSLPNAIQTHIIWLSFPKLFHKVPTEKSFFVRSFVRSTLVECEYF